jgi:hypothetical protein
MGTHQSDCDWAETFRILHAINELQDGMLRRALEAEGGADVRAEFEQSYRSDLEELNAILAQIVGQVEQQQSSGRVPSPQADHAGPTYEEEEEDGTDAYCEWPKTNEILNEVSEMNELLSRIVDEEIGGDGTEIQVRLLQSRVSFIEKVNALLVQEVELAQKEAHEASLRQECTCMTYEAVHASRNERIWQQACETLREVGKSYENLLRRVDEEVRGGGAEIKLRYLQSKVSYLQQVNASLLRIVRRLGQGSAGGAALLRGRAQPSNATPRSHAVELDDDGENVPAEDDGEASTSTGVQHDRNDVTIPLKGILRVRKDEEGGSAGPTDMKGNVEDGRISRGGVASVTFTVYAQAKRNELEGL